MRILYLTYDGLSDPLGKSQILPYIIGLSKRNHKIDIISFEKNQTEYNKLNENLISKGIKSKMFKYTKYPPLLSTFYDIFRLLGYLLFKKTRYDIIHARSYVMALVAWIMFKLFKSPFIFDMRGWWIDERIESQAIPKRFSKPIIKFYRFLETKFLLDSKIIICLTKRSSQIIQKRFPNFKSKLYVTSTCVNTDYFFINNLVRERIRKGLNISENSFVMIYSGTVGGYYDLGSMVLVFKQLLNVNLNSYFVFLSKANHLKIWSEMDKIGISKKNVRVISVEYEKVNDFLNASDVGLVLYTNQFSSTARNPTKLGEYWSTGLPVLAPKNVGDLDELFDKYPSGGVQFDDMTEKGLENTWNLYFRKFSGLQNNKILISEGRREFSLKEGIQFYSNIYLSLKKKDF